MDNFLDVLRNDHSEFDQGRLEDQVGNNPMDLLAKWLRNATEKGVSEPNAIAISTINSDGFPQTRIVYLRELLEEGFVFYTNYLSSKGKALAVHPKMHGLLFWPGLERQISISGICEKIPSEMSDAYFKERPRGSQLGAWASHQSDVLISRKELEDRVLYYSEKFPNEVPRPPHWGGYLVKPSRFEFWQGRPSRLHDRIVFQFENENWKVFRLNP
ncbi:MAG: pyridoxamine 5'-phosphate oxidase [Crocinitomicaceae bacterium]